MSKYLHVFTLDERWETLKSSNVHTIYPLIDEIERLSQNPTNQQIQIVRQLERKYQEDINELEKEDQNVLEDMIVRILFQAYQQTMESLKRWDFALERAADKGFEKEFVAINDVVKQSEEAMRRFSSSGSSPEEYVQEQKQYLTKIDQLFAPAKKRMLTHLSSFYQGFFERNVDRKREVIQRHIDHFQNNTFGEWMRSLREDNGWSLSRAADETGVSSSYIHRIEKGTRGVPSTKKLEQLAAGYNLPFNEVIIMASGEVKPVETFIEEGAFQLNGTLATKKQKHAIAEMVRMVVEGDAEEAQEQMTLVRSLMSSL